MKRKRLPLTLALFAWLSLAACGASKVPPPADPQVAGVDAGPVQPDGASPQQTLYERLGRQEGINAIGDIFLKKLKADPRIAAFFKNKRDLVSLKKQLCQLSGGPCQYTGKDMKSAHRGMEITGAQFDAFIEDFKLALAEKGVSPQDESDLLATLTPMRADIVERKEKK